MERLDFTSTKSNKIELKDLSAEKHYQSISLELIKGSVAVIGPFSFC